MLAIAVSCGAPKSSPHLISSKPFSCKNLIASSYVILGNGAFTFSNFDVSRPNVFNSNAQFFNTD